MSIHKTFKLGADININRMGFGAMRLTGTGVWGPPENKQEALAVYRKAVDLGVNFIDTADSYGPYVSEEMIAEALYPYPNKLLIGTKGGLTRTGPNVWPVNASPKHLEEALHGSLKRLKLETIDLYQLHRIDPNVPAEDSFAFLQKAQKEGKIRHLGLSEVSVDQIKLAQTFFKVVSVQNMYSLEKRQWEAELDYCTASNIAFIPWYPLNANGVKNQSVLQEIATKNGKSVQQIALSWLLHRASNILLIPGTSKLTHLEENVKAQDIELSVEDFAALDAIAKP